MSAPEFPPFDTRHGFERMRERTRETRESEAARLFGGENANAVFSAAAAKGQTAAIFTPSPPMDLSNTETGKAFKATLESAGFSVEWKRMQAGPDAEPHTVLRVSWGTDAKRGA